MTSRISVQVSPKDDGSGVLEVHCSGCGGFLGQDWIKDGLAVFYCRKCKIRAIVLAGSAASLTMAELNVMIGEQ